jgi:hypothetical protein
VLREGVNTVNKTEDSIRRTRWRTPKRKLCGDGHGMVSIPRKVVIRFSFWDDGRNQPSPQFGRHKRSLNVRFFAWILLRHKILTANNLAKRGWPHDPMCPLCNAAPETPTHLCLECPFTQNVWMHLTSHLGRQDLQIAASHTISAWWRRLLHSFDKKQKAKFDRLMLYFWWNIWKERNRRIFQSNSLEVAEVAQLITNDTKLYREARTFKQTRTPPG